MNESKFSVSKRKVVAAVAAVAAFAAVTVSAATLGGLQTDSVGANSNVVAAPLQGGVALSWDTEYSSTQSAYTVTGINLKTLKDEEFSASSDIRVTLTGAKGVVLGEYSSADGAGTWITPKEEIPAHDVEGASVVINGGAVTAVVSETN